jgi:hypothetical protein
MAYQKKSPPVEVFKVKGETMKIASNNLKQEKGFDNHHLEI